jgi:hypothetical protein
MHEIVNGKTIKNLSYLSLLNMTFFIFNYLGRSNVRRVTLVLYKFMSVSESAPRNILRLTSPTIMGERSLSYGGGKIKELS